MITGINVGDFGKNTKNNFFDLIKALDKVDSVERYRISSLEPELLSEEMIRYILDSKRFMPHFHLPLQTGCDELLRNMKRRYDTEIFNSRIKQIRSFSKTAGIGVDVIVGLPGETEENFIQTYDFLNQIDISYLHVFSYSKRKNTMAARMDGHIPDKLITERSHKLQNLSVRKYNEFIRKNIDRDHKVLFEDTFPNNIFFGYTYDYIGVGYRGIGKIKIKGYEAKITE